MQDFRHVRAWQSAVLVALKARKLAEMCPRRDYSELREQLTTATESISHNIAEGRAASPPKEFLRFLDMAVRSASEASSQVHLALEYEIASKKATFDLIGTIICTQRMILSLQDEVRIDLKRGVRKRPKRPK